MFGEQNVPRNHNRQPFVLSCMLNISIIMWNIFSYHSYVKQYLYEGHLSHFALSYIFGSLGAQTAAGAGGVIHLQSERHLDYHLLWPS